MESCSDLENERSLSEGRSVCKECQQFSLWWINSGSGSLSASESIKSGMFDPDSDADTDTENLASTIMRIAQGKRI